MKKTTLALKMRMAMMLVAGMGIPHVNAEAAPREFVVYSLKQSNQKAPLGLRKLKNLSSNGRLFLAKQDSLGTFMIHSQSDDFLIEPNVKFVQIKPQISEEKMLPNDEFFGLQWNLKNTGQVDTNTGEIGIVGADIDYAALESAPAIINPNVKVAVIDSGIEASHPDLTGLKITGTNLVEGEEQNQALTDELGHGTHVAGVISANTANGIGIAGIQNAAQVQSIKIFDASGSSSLDKVIKAIEKAVEGGAQIVNLSLGGTERSEILFQIMKSAASKGVLFVTAAGNEASDLADSPVYPAAYDLSNQIVVASSNRKDQLSRFSNYNAEKVDIAAPGERILSTFMGAQYKSLSGTSMATPHVAAAAALLLQRRSLSPEELKFQIGSKAQKLGALTGKVRQGARLSLSKLFEL